MLGHIPLPAKISVRALDAINIREEFGDDPDIDAVYDDLVAVMQETLTALQRGRRLPVIG
jgi:hypothetical protein